MPGHVFLVRGDLRRLACDAWLCPGDVRQGPGELPRELRELARGWKDSAVRVRTPADSPADRPRPWLTNQQANQGDPAKAYAEAVRQFLAEASRRVQGGPRWFERSQPLLALPILGSANEPEHDRAGQLIAELLQLLQQTVQRADFDVALVARDGPALAAAQAARRQFGGDAWPALDRSLREPARALAGLASGGELSLFLGAGVSAGAGLPLWGELLQRLAEKAGMAEDERQALRKLNPLDQAGLIERRLGGGEGLQRAIREVFTWPYYALPHALLAALPVHEVVTTNYDQLFEMAWEDQGRHASVLPYRLLPDADGWMLKMHGSVAHAEDIVLTREDHVSYGARHGALAGVVQTLLITRHMLFVGFSLNDDNFHRIAEAVRRVVRAADRPEAGDKPFGTALVLERNRLMEELWSEDLKWVSMLDADANGRRDPGRHLEAARRLEIFLDYLLAETRATAHLLDDRYPALLTDEEKELRDALLDFTHRVGPRARRAPAWGQVERLLAGLGLREQEASGEGNST